MDSYKRSVYINIKSPTLIEPDYMSHKASIRLIPRPVLNINAYPKFSQQSDVETFHDYAFCCIII